MYDLPDSMYDYRPDNNEMYGREEHEHIGECHMCGEDIYDNDEYTYCNDALFHEDCLIDYQEENEAEDEE